MRTTRFNCSENSLCTIAGVEFKNLTPQQRNQVRTLNMYFNTPETYHPDVISELRDLSDDVSLAIGDATVMSGITYYPVTSANTAPPVSNKPSVAEMSTKLAARLNIPIEIIESWDEMYIEVAFTSCGLMPRPKTDNKIVGYLLVDGNSQYPRFKVSPADPSFVVKQYAEYVEQQIVKDSAPVTN